MIGFIKYLNINKDYPLPVVRQADDSGYLVLGSVDYTKPKEDVDFFRAEAALRRSLLRLQLKS